MSRYCYVVSACKKYVPELCALLNSLERTGNQEDVHVIGYELPDSFVSQFSSLSYQVILHPVSEPEARQYGGEGEILCRKRYYYAAEFGKYYEATCILDADMVFVRPPTAYFHLAATSGYLLGAALEQKRVYGHIEHHQLGDGTKLLDKPVWNAKDICCAPIFCDMRLDKPWAAIFRNSWQFFVDGFKAPDMEAINISILAAGMSDRVVLMPNVMWVGTNEQFLKPYQRIVRQVSDPAPGGQIWTETGSPVFILHGQPYKQRWRDQQIRNRMQCSDGYLGGCRKSVELAVGALELLYTYFKSCLDYRIHVEKIAYTETGAPGDSLLTFDPFGVNDAL